MALAVRLHLMVDDETARFDASRRDSLIASVEATVRTRLAIYENVLSAAAGDLATSEHLTSRKDWSVFVEHARLFEKYPGAEVMSIIQPVADADMGAFLAAQRKQDPGFQLRAPFGLSTLGKHLVVIAAEPPNIATRAVGSDLAGDPRRRTAAERARDMGSFALTRNVNPGNPSSISLQMYIPVYRSGLPAATVEQRRAALRSYIAVVFSADTFLRSAMRGRDQYLEMQVFDGAPSAATRLFSSTAQPKAPSADSFERVTTLNLEGAKWTVGWNRGPKFQYVSRTPSQWALVFGLVVTLLIAAVVYLLQSAARRTAKKLAAEQSRAEETHAFLASLVHSSQDSIIGTTLDGIIKSWNRGSEVLWGYSAEEAIGQHITILFPEQRRGDYLRQIVKIEQGEAIEPFESVRVTRDGRRIDVSVIISPIKDSSGRLLGLSGIYTDISARKRAEEELIRAKEAAEAANRAKSQFLANMSHEIRTPMNGILGMTEAALETPLDMEQREYLTTAKSSAEALLTIINDILDFSKIEAGMLQLETAEFDVREMVAETVKLLSLAARQKGLELAARTDDSVPDAVRGDALRIRQVLVNLLGNAVKFTSRGKVAMDVAVDCSAPPACMLCFTVKDTGIGISREKQQLIFAPFTQADGSTTRQYGGTGLGLTISRRLVEMMGGRIWVESELHRGSTFCFTIPVVCGAPKFAQEPAAASVLPA